MTRGLSNAPDTFNRCFTDLLRPMRGFAPSYFDDVLVHSRAIDEITDVEVHRIFIRKFITLMREHTMYANLKKCIFAAREIPLLRYMVGIYGARTNPEKTKTTTYYPVPFDVKGLGSFLE